MYRFVVGAGLLSIVGFVSAASAADLPERVNTKAPTIAVPAYSWTGCYIGVEGGGNWGRSEQIARSGPAAGASITGGFDLSGGIAGGTVGCNYQINSFVFGIENDYSWTNKKGSAPDQLPFNTGATSSTNEKWIDTLRGRAGYSWDQYLLYVTAGGAWAGTSVDVKNVAFVTDSRTRTGWVAGVGGEWAASTGPWGTLTFKLEYLHADFGTQQYINPPVFTGIGTVVTRDVKLTDDMVRAGMNLKFNWGGPVVAKY
jgi:outer membrane immunogenic protein